MMNNLNKRIKSASAQMPPEFQAFASALLSENYDADKVTSTAGLAIITIDSAKIAQNFGGSDGAFHRATTYGSSTKRRTKFNK